MNTSCVINDVEFPIEVIANMDEFDSTSIPDGFSFYFMCEVLAYRPQWLRTLKRNRQMIMDRSARWIVSSEVDDGEIVTEFGVGPTRARASDVSAGRLFCTLERRNPGYFMPEFLIGYPNIRGHCFLISTIVPLVHSYPFLITLLRIQRRLNIERNRGITVAGDGEKVFRLVERASYWCDLLYKLHINYQKIARVGCVSSVNEPIVARRAIRGNSPVMKPVYVKPKSDLVLDNDLVRGLVTSLRNYCSGEYSDAGGDERLSYRNILCKLASEEESFRDVCFLKVKVNYTCSGCVGGPYVSVYHLPLILTNCKLSFQDMFDRLDDMIKMQGLRCNRLVNGIVCDENLNLILSSSIINVPKILCIATKHDIEVIPVDKALSLSISDTEKKYSLFCLSKCFECFKSKDGVPYGDYCRSPLPDDESDGWHTYPVLKTHNGFIEVNNGVLYKPDVKILWKTTPGALHFYQLKCYDRFKPKVDMDYVHENPHNLRD